MKYTTTAAVANFKCLQADCPDTCCKGWSMQLDDRTYAKYTGELELENAVAYDSVDGEIRVMKRDTKTDYCVKFTDGKCGIHAKFGEEFLGDACNFYPRVTRKLGDEIVMTATMSCPEIARLELFEDSANNQVKAEAIRLPINMRDYLPEGLTTEQAQKVHQVFLDACLEEVSPEKIIARIYSASESLKYIPQAEWADAAGFMLRMADGKLPEAIPDKADYYKLLQIFAGIIHATGKKHNERLIETLVEMERALGVSVDWETLEFRASIAGNLDWTIAQWRRNSGKYDFILRKFIQSQLSFSSFPFAGIAKDISEKVRMLIFRFSITRLTLMSLDADANEATIIRSIQSIARVLDHLGDATLTLNLFENSGWTTDGRIRGLIEG